MITDLDLRTEKEKIVEAYENKDLKKLKMLALNANFLENEMRQFHNSAMMSLAEELEMDMEEFKEEPRFKWVSLELSSIMTELKTLRAFKEHHYVGKD